MGVGVRVGVGVLVGVSVGNRDAVGVSVCAGVTGSWELVVGTTLGCAPVRAVRGGAGVWVGAFCAVQPASPRHAPTKVRMAWESTLLPDEDEIDPEEKEILCQPMDDDAAAAWATAQLGRDIAQSEAIAMMHRIADKVERGEQVGGGWTPAEINQMIEESRDAHEQVDTSNDFDEIMDEIDPLGQEQKNWGAST